MSRLKNPNLILTTTIIDHVPIFRLPSFSIPTCSGLMYTHTRPYSLFQNEYTFHFHCMRQIIQNGNSIDSFTKEVEGSNDLDALKELQLKDSDVSSQPKCKNTTDDNLGLKIDTKKKIEVKKTSVSFNR
ncbi:unnamed protein product [Lactuca saligna]|uniref:Uncharacterized protein n=1 Tax=Lactuca saligna TaxID=75948 RepID=A0AA35Z162_LACSI|nr:unnamed protein product [Lactuca saligna]